jgi:hypothetical protein
MRDELYPKVAPKPIGLEGPETSRNPPGEIIRGM